MKKQLEEDMSSQVINFDKKYCELERNYESRIGKRDNRIKQLEHEIIQLNESLVNLKSDMTSLCQEFDQKVAQKTFDNNNNNKNVVDELRLKLSKLNEKINNGPKNSSYSLLIEINKAEQHAKTQQQKLEV